MLACHQDGFACANQGREEARPSAHRRKRDAFLEDFSI
jgi:hypothetical protein